MQTYSIPGRKLYCPVLVNIAIDVSLKLYSSAVKEDFHRDLKTQHLHKLIRRGRRGLGGRVWIPITPLGMPLQAPLPDSLFMQTSLDVYEKLIPNSWSTKT